MDERARDLERAVRASPDDVRLRFDFYVQRLRQGDDGPLRPALPVPPLPGIFRGFRSVKRFDLTRQDFVFMRQDRPPGINPEDPFGNDDFEASFEVIEPKDLRTTDFPEDRRRPMSPEELNTVHRWMIAVAGHGRAFAAWRQHGVDPEPGWEICLGLAFEAANVVARCETDAFLEDEAGRVRDRAVVVRDAVACPRCDVDAGNECKRAKLNVHTVRTQAYEAKLVAENRAREALEREQVVRARLRNAPADDEDTDEDDPDEEFLTTDESPSWRAEGDDELADELAHDASCDYCEFKDWAKRGFQIVTTPSGAGVRMCAWCREVCRTEDPSESEILDAILEEAR